MRILFRLFSLTFLIAAIIAGVLDAVHSVASGEMIFEDFGAAWASFHNASFTAFEAFARSNLHPNIWDPGMEWILVQPTIAVCLALSFVFYIIAYKHVRPEERYVSH